MTANLSEGCSSIGEKDGIHGTNSRDDTAVDDADDVDVDAASTDPDLDAPELAAQRFRSQHNDCAETQIDGPDTDDELQEFLYGHDGDVPASVAQHDGDGCQVDADAGDEVILVSDGSDIDIDMKDQGAKDIVLVPEESDDEGKDQVATDGLADDYAGAGGLADGWYSSITPWKDLTRMQEIVAEVGLMDGMSWDLAPPYLCDPISLQCHINRIIADLLREFPWGFYKVGITYVPADRFGKADYNHDGHHMRLAICSESPKVIADAESVAIERLRRYDARGIFVNALGDPRCLNRAKGGLGAYHGIPPHFLYVCIGRFEDWHKYEALDSASKRSSWDAAFDRRLGIAREKIRRMTRSPRLAAEPA